MKKSIKYSIVAHHRLLSSRLSWKSFESSLHDKQFRRMFRMTKGCFHELCHQISSAVGENSFKSEDYLLMMKDHVKTSQGQNKMSGGVISGT